MRWGAWGWERLVGVGLGDVANQGIKGEGVDVAIG